MDSIVIDVVADSTEIYEWMDQWREMYSVVEFTLSDDQPEHGYFVIVDGQRNAVDEFENWFYSDGEVL